MRKRILSLILVATMTASIFTGCGKGGDSNSNATPTQGATAEEGLWADYKIDLTKNLSNPNATDKAQAVYNWLCSIEGKYIISGQQEKCAEYAFQCHILRLGNIAIATNPFELYQEFAQRIKARAEAEQVFIVQLSNGLGGYLPTWAAVNGGSYSSKPASTVCGPDGGDVLVEKTLDVLAQLWK